MQMTDWEICRSYRQADNKRAQIQILADLNATSSKKIEEILVANGEKKNRGKPMKQETKDRLEQERLERMKEQEEEAPEIQWKEAPKVEEDPYVLMGAAEELADAGVDETVWKGAAEKAATLMKEEEETTIPASDIQGPFIWGRSETTKEVAEAVPETVMAMVSEWLIENRDEYRRVKEFTDRFEETEQWFLRRNG